MYFIPQSQFLTRPLWGCQMCSLNDLSYKYKANWQHKFKLQQSCSQISEKCLFPHTPSVSALLFPRATVSGPLIFRCAAKMWKNLVAALWRSSWLLNNSGPVIWYSAFVCVWVYICVYWWHACSACAQWRQIEPTEVDTSPTPFTSLAT